MFFLSTMLLDIINFLFDSNNFNNFDIRQYSMLNNATILDLINKLKLDNCVKHYYQNKARWSNISYNQFYEMINKIKNFNTSSQENINSYYSSSVHNPNTKHIMVGDLHGDAVILKKILSNNINVSNIVINGDIFDIVNFETSNEENEIYTKRDIHIFSNNKDSAEGLGLIICTEPIVELYLLILFLIFSSTKINIVLGNHDINYAFNHLFTCLFFNLKNITKDLCIIYNICNNIVHNINLYDERINNIIGQNLIITNNLEDYLFSNVPININIFEQNIKHIKENINTKINNFTNFYINEYNKAIQYLFNTVQAKQAEFNNLFASNNELLNDYNKLKLLINNNNLSKKSEELNNQELELINNLMNNKFLLKFKEEHIFNNILYYNELLNIIKSIKIDLNNLCNYDNIIICNSDNIFKALNNIYNHIDFSLVHTVNINNSPICKVKHTPNKKKIVNKATNQINTIGIKNTPVINNSTYNINDFFYLMTMFIFCINNANIESFSKMNYRNYEIMQYNYLPTQLKSVLCSHINDRNYYKIKNGKMIKNDTNIYSRYYPTCYLINDNIKTEYFVFEILLNTITNTNQIYYDQRVLEFGTTSNVSFIENNNNEIKFNIYHGSIQTYENIIDKIECSLSYNFIYNNIKTIYAHTNYEDDYVLNNATDFYNRPIYDKIKKPIYSHLELYENYFNKCFSNSEDIIPDEINNNNNNIGLNLQMSITRNSDNRLNALNFKPFGYENPYKYLTCVFFVSLIFDNTTGCNKFYINYAPYYVTSYVNELNNITKDCFVTNGQFKINDIVYTSEFYLLNESKPYCMSKNNHSILPP